ncbi:hypothetical protein [Streptomyces sp. NPDC002788]
MRSLWLLRIPVRPLRLLLWMSVRVLWLPVRRLVLVLRWRRRHALGDPVVE